MKASKDSLKSVWLLLMGMYNTMDILYNKQPEHYLDINTKKVLQSWYKLKK